MTTRSDLKTEFESTDLGNARRLVNAHGEFFRYAPQLGQWLTWDGRRWADDATGEIVRYAKQITDMILDDGHLTSDEKLFSWGKRSQSAPCIANMISLAKTEEGIPVLVKHLDADPYEFNVRNGTLNLRTGELHAHRQSDLITKLADIIYDPEAQCPTWLETLNGIFAGDQSLVKFLQLFAGYSLTGIVSEQKMTFSHGTGANGKTTIMNALRAITGDYGISLASDVLIDSGHEGHSTGITDLRGARFVTATETEEGRRFNESLVKQLTGSDPIKARRMRTDNFEFQPTHKLWMSGNHLPRIQGTDHAIWRRLALLPFEVRFPIDPTLSDRLFKETSGILAWAVQGCLEWQSDGLQIPERVDAATQGYRDSQDHIGRFIADECIVREQCYVSSVVLRRAYESWCEEQGEKAWSATAVGRELSNRGYESKRTNKARIWAGIGLATEENAS
jgi:putative DNA primase/helicase